jgi:hypothetical protein
VAFKERDTREETPLSMSSFHQSRKESVAGSQPEILAAPGTSSSMRQHQDTQQVKWIKSKREINLKEAPPVSKQYKNKTSSVNIKAKVDKMQSSDAFSNRQNNGKNQV